MRSKLIQLPITVAFLLLLLPAVWAQESWEGSAIVGRYGEFPPGGLYAASNAFPLNSVIEVTNPDTGRTQRLIVAQRAANPGVLLVVSQTAAEELGVSRSATFRVQVEPVEMPPLTSVPPSEDLPFHPDPDINPRAAVGDPNAALLQPGVPGMPEAAAEEAPTEEPEVAEAPPEEPEVPAEEPPEEPVEPEAIVEAEEAPEEAPSDAPEPSPEPIPAPGTTPGPPSITVLPEAEPEPEEPESEEPEEAPAVAEAPEGPGEKDLFPPAPDEELYAALATPVRPEEEDLVTELPLAPVDEAAEVEADSLGPQFPNPVELIVTLPEPPEVETPEATDLAPPRPEERAPAGELAMASPGEAGGPDMSEELAERPERPEGAVTEIPLRIVEEIEPPKAEEERITRPARKPGEEIVSLEPAEFRPPEPEDEEALTPADRPETQPEEPRVTEAPEPPREEAPSERRPTPAERPGAVAAESEAAAKEDLPLTSRLSEEGYYLQVGAFSDPQGAQAAVSRLGADFPVKVVPSDGDIYRVFVGPLKEDERGAVLYLVRARGYRDAFLRSSSDG